ncbi:MAG: amidohydrolase family protein [Mariniphaga sp.]|nr:amidohydrolase family protein [Mariniphaga sp.]
MVERILIKGSFLWDGISEDLRPEGAIIVEGKKIKSIISCTETDSSSYEKILDFSGLTILPGMIDCHTHHSMDATLENYLDRMKDSIPELTIRATAMMKKDLLSGVTTCRTLGDREYLDVACRESVKGGLTEGPRSIVAGKGIRAANGHGFVGYPFNGTEEISNAIKENLTAGADFIKIYITGTLRGGGNLPSYLTKEEIETAIITAHEAGLRVASHCVGGTGLDWALDLGLDTLEHAYHISDTQIEKLAKSNTLLVLTLSPILNDEIVNHYPKHLIQGHFDERDIITQSLKLIIDASIPFALGTDGNHGGLAEEAKYAVKLGASNFETLQAATINGAKICGIEKETGSLIPGKFADIIAVEGNPLEKISTLKNIKAVIQQGKLILAV